MMEAVQRERESERARSETTMTQNTLVVPIEI